MPKDTKRRTKKQSTSDSDSGPDDKGPAPRAEPPAKKAKSSTSALRSDRPDSDELSWNLGQSRFVKLTQFKGKWYVNIREFYAADTGDLRPGKKGIMLTMEQWYKFHQSIPELQDAIKKNI